MVLKYMGYKYFFELIIVNIYMQFLEAQQQQLIKKPTENNWQNPVLNRDFADPTVIKTNGKFYAYATQGTPDGKLLNIQVASSTDMFNWKTEGDALSQKPTWAKSTSSFWAPHVLYDASIKKYVWFFHLPPMIHCWVYVLVLLLPICRQGLLLIKAVHLFAEKVL